MIQVVVIYDKEKVLDVTVTGHANAADKGEDLVCAGVSAITVGALNALDMLAQATVNDSVDEGFVHIHVNKLDDAQQTILQTMLIQLQSVEQAHSKYITIKKQEV